MTFTFHFCGLRATVRCDALRQDLPCMRGDPYSRNWKDNMNWSLKKAIFAGCRSWHFLLIYFFYPQEGRNGKNVFHKCAWLLTFLVVEHRAYCPSGNIICFLIAYGHTKNVAFCKKAVTNNRWSFCDRKCHRNHLVFYDMTLLSSMDYQHYIYIYIYACTIVCQWL